MTLATLKQHRRKLVIIASITLVVLLIATYLLWSVSVWNTYKTTYESWQKELRASVNAAIARPATTSSERTNKRTAFKDISTSIDSAQQSLCRTPLLIGWQRTIDGLRQREESCEKVIRNAKVFGQKMQTTIIYLEKEQTLATTITKALTAAEGYVTEGTWDSQVTIWQNANKSIAGISATETPFAKIKATALEKTQLVASAWQELIAAHAAKDKTKYLEAQGRLATVYEGFAALSTASTEQLAVLTTSLQAAYSQVFGSST